MYVMKNLIFSIALLISIAGCAQIKKATMPDKYDVAVSFNSVSAGPPSSGFLKNFVKSFNHENKVTLQAFQKGGCGREGEYYVLFSLKNIKENLQSSFKKQLEELIPKVNEETRLKNPSKGPVQFVNEINVSELQHCRGELGVWDYNNNNGD
jgi:hypothetical protein